MSESIDPPYTRHDYSISMAMANVYSLLIIGPLVILLVALYCGVWGVEKTLIQFSSIYDNPARLGITYLIFFGLLAAGVIVHEVTHAVTWVLVGKKPWSAVHFGFQISTLTPYAHCREPLPAGAYRIGTFMPGLLTGLLPALLGTLLGNGWLAFMGGVLLAAASGDLLILLLIRKVPGYALVQDHPTRAGCFVLESKAS